MRARQRHAEDRVRAELALVRRAVEVDQEVVDAGLVDGVQPEQLRGDPLGRRCGPRSARPCRRSGPCRRRAARRPRGRRSRRRTAPPPARPSRRRGRRRPRPSGLPRESRISRASMKSMVVTRRLRWSPLVDRAGRSRRAAPGPRGTPATRRRRSRCGSSGRPGPAGRWPRPSRRHRPRPSRRHRRASASIRATAFVPWANEGISNTPSGPFQNTVLASARASTMRSWLGLAEVDDVPAGRDLLGRERLVLGPAGDLLGHDDVDRQDDRTPCFSARGQDAPGVLDPVGLGQALADRPCPGRAGTCWPCRRRGRAGRPCRAGCR